jgi:hypothetical protein
MTIDGEGRLSHTEAASAGGEIWVHGVAVCLDVRDDVWPLECVVAQVITSPSGMPPCHHTTGFGGDHSRRA